MLILFFLDPKSQWFEFKADAVIGLSVHGSSLPNAYVQAQSIFGILWHCGIAVTLVVSAGWGLYQSRFQQKVVVQWWLGNSWSSRIWMLAQQIMHRVHPYGPTPIAGKSSETYRTELVQSTADDMRWTLDGTWWGYFQLGNPEGITYDQPLNPLESCLVAHCHGWAGFRMWHLQMTRCWKVLVPATVAVVLLVLCHQVL